MSYNRPDPESDVMAGGCLVAVVGAIVGAIIGLVVVKVATGGEDEGGIQIVPDFDNELGMVGGALIGTVVSLVGFAIWKVARRRSRKGFVALVGIAVIVIALTGAVRFQSRREQRTATDLATRFLEASQRGDTEAACALATPKLSWASGYGERCDRVAARVKAFLRDDPIPPLDSTNLIPSGGVLTLASDPATSGGLYLEMDVDVGAERVVNVYALRTG